MYRSGSPQMPRVMPGHGLVHTSSPTSPGGSGAPSGSYTSIAMPNAGEPSVHGRSGVSGEHDRKHAPTSVPPLMLTIGARPSPTLARNQRQGSGFHGSPVLARMRSDDRSCERGR